jgi:hypothetical protein
MVSTEMGAWVEKKFSKRGVGERWSMTRRGVSGRGEAVVAGEATRRHRVGYVGAVRGPCPPPGRCRSGPARPRVVRCVVRTRADALLARGARASLSASAPEASLEYAHSWALRVTTDASSSGGLSVIRRLAASAPLTARGRPLTRGCVRRPSRLASG